MLYTSCLTFPFAPIFLGSGRGIQQQGEGEREGKATVTVLAPLGVKGEDVGNDGGGNRRQIWTGAKGDEDEERERETSMRKSTTADKVTNRVFCFRE